MELGKHGKLKGQKHPRDLRRIDSEPPRSTPAAKPRRKAEKPFGIAYEIQWPKFSEGRVRWIWTPRERWFETERQRDQSLADAIKKSVQSDMERNHRACVRPEHPTGNA